MTLLRLLLLGCTIVGATSHLAAQVPNPNPSVPGKDLELKSARKVDLSRAYGFCLGQRMRLKGIPERFPDLRLQVTDAEKKWNLQFGEAETRVGQRLQQEMGAEWPALRDEMHSKMTGPLQEELRAMTPNVALAFLEVVAKRSRGDIHSPVLEMLLASHPSFETSPANEMATGFVGEYSTKGHPKALGLEMTLKYPLSWKPMEGNRPRMVRMWRSDGGHGPDFFALSVSQFPADTTAADLAELFTEEGAKPMLDEATKLVKFTKSKLEGQALAILQVVQTFERVGEKMEVPGFWYYLVYENRLIMLQVNSFDRDPKKATERIPLLDAVMKSIANSVVIPGAYR